MTKAERDAQIARSIENDDGICPIWVRDQIDALEAQLTVSKERIRLLREALGGITCSCGAKPCTETCNLMIALMAFRIDDAIKNADAKEGEGK